MSGISRVNQRVHGYPSTHSNRVPRYPRVLTRVPGPLILGEYEVFLVPTTGNSKPGNTREYSGNWRKVNTSWPEHTPANIFSFLIQLLLTPYCSGMQLVAGGLSPALGPVGGRPCRARGEIFPSWLSHKVAVGSAAPVEGSHPPIINPCVYIYIYISNESGT